MEGSDHTGSSVIAPRVAKLNVAVFRGEDGANTTPCAQFHQQRIIIQPLGDSNVQAQGLRMVKCDKGVININSS